MQKKQTGRLVVSMRLSSGTPHSQGLYLSSMAGLATCISCRGKKGGGKSIPHLSSPGHQIIVSRDCGRRRRRHHHHHPLRGRRRTRDRVAPVATSRRLSLGGRGEARRGPSTVGKVVNILEAGGLNRNPNLPSFILPWWTPDCRDFGLKKERKAKEKKKRFGLFKVI